MARRGPDLSHLAVQGTRLSLRVTPGASRNAVLAPEIDGAPIKVQVTAVAEGGKANAAVLKLLSKALGVPKSRLEVVRGTTGRNKIVKIT